MHSPLYSPPLILQPQQRTRLTPKGMEGIAANYRVSPLFTGYQKRPQINDMSNKHTGRCFRLRKLTG